MIMMTDKAVMMAHGVSLHTVAKCFLTKGVKRESGEHIKCFSHFGF